MISTKIITAGIFVAALATTQAPTARAAEQPKEAAKDPYGYTAKAGDNYTVLARKAVQTYGLREKVNLKLAQIIAAETMLASAAGFPEINEGQSIKFDPTKVKQVMEDAKKIAGDALAAWEVYVPYVDFDTRDNG